MQAIIYSNAGPAQPSLASDHALRRGIMQTQYHDDEKQKEEQMHAKSGISAIGYITPHHPDRASQGHGHDRFSVCRPTHVGFLICTAD